jgi:hypothetical protein
MVGLSIPAWGGNGQYGFTLMGTVHIVQQNSTLQAGSPETILFSVDGQPTPLHCGNYFVISPNSITDAQTRKNLVALLMMAKSTGNQIEVAYDSQSGTPCDQGMTPVYFIELL